MAQADRNNNGFLEENEAIRLCKQFLAKSQAAPNADPVSDVQIHAMFRTLDMNDDGLLSESEVETTLRAMWLMHRDHVPLDELTGEYVGKTEEPVSPITTTTVGNTESTPYREEERNRPSRENKQETTTNSPVDSRFVLVPTQLKLDARKLSEVWLA